MKPNPPVDKQTNIAMILTVGRLTISPVFAYLFFLESIQARLLTFLIFVVSEMSDFFDGYIARRRNEVTDLGKILDPLADSITHLTIFLCFTWEHLIPLYMVLIIFYRESLVATLRTVCAFKSVVVSARKSGKVKTACMAFGVGAALFLRIFEGLNWAFPYHTVYLWIFGIIALVTLWSAVDYFWANGRHIDFS